MKTNKKSKLYEKGLRILQREMHRLDLISQGKKPLLKGLNSFQISDLIKLMRPLEATIKEDPKRESKKEKPSEAVIRRAREVLAEIDGKSDASALKDSGSPNTDESI